jgi:hypothetical protein
LFAATWRQLAIVDTDPLAPIATVPLASDDATRVLYDAAARLAYISHPDHDLLSVVDVDSASQVATIALPARPAEMALLPAAPSGDIAPPASRIAAGPAGAARPGPRRHRSRFPRPWQESTTRLKQRPGIT